MTARYAEIAVTTNFSFLSGASHPSELVLAAALLGMDAIGIADVNTLAGVVRAYAALGNPDFPAHKPKLLVGARLVFADDTPDILAYPTERKSYGRLSQLLSRGKLRAEKGECHIVFDDLLEFQEGMLFAVVPHWIFLPLPPFCAVSPALRRGACGWRRPCCITVTTGGG